MYRLKCFIIFIISSTLCNIVFAANKTIDFTIENQTVNFTGISKQAIAVNGKIPGPVLRLQEGDDVVINVHNKLDEGTSIHWHGVLVPWQMDGVTGVSQREILPGETFTYAFSAQQGGTYWYHSHTGLQVQEGLYGGIIIEPAIKPQYEYNKDYVIVLSDWSNTLANIIMHNLERNGAYYSSRYNLHEYNDVAYDAFLLNGRTSKNPWTKQVKIGDVVRLRFIGAGSSTIFRVKIPQQQMHTVNVQGNDVQPYMCTDFTVAPGETHDVVIKIEKNQPYIIYAESLDKIGAVYGALFTSLDQNINSIVVEPFAQKDTVDLSNKYKDIVAAVATNDPYKPIDNTINMALSGSMSNYVWTINDATGFKEQPIILEPNKRYRIIFTNNSMMPHPMHLHGHWFIWRRGRGAFDPLLHTIVVAPNATINVDVDTDASGQWILHCHTLYHMMTGMFRIMQYSTLQEIIAGKMPPENIVKQTKYINRPIIRVDAARPINAALVKQPMMR